VPWRDALLPIADSLRARDPYRAALLGAQWATQNVTRDARQARGRIAERYAREALRLAPDSVAPISALAGAFIVDERWVAGLAVLDSLATHQANRLAAYYQIGRLSAMSGLRLDDGERALRSYLAGEPPAGAPSKATAFWRLGTILQKKGDIAGARRAYEAGLALEPANANLIAAIGSMARPPLH
jgi:tetratricopeptide (TPR) repeat protein